MPQSESCGSSALVRYSDSDADLQELADTIDAAVLHNIVSETARLWSVSRAVALIGAWRMKQLFESYATRRAAVEATSYQSWSEWITSIDWPISPSLIRTRVLDIAAFLNQGAAWETIRDILANAPTAGHDVLEQVVDQEGQLLSHIRAEDLPGGSVQGLLEAIARAPNPSQGRTLVGRASGRPRVYPTRLVSTDGVLYINLTVEHPGGDVQYYGELTVSNADGERVPLSPTIAHWLADKLSVNLEQLTS